MQDSLHTIHEKEIDLRELFMIAWAYKVFITVFCIIGTLSGAYYALNADKEFTSTASFVLNLQNTNKNLANFKYIECSISHPSEEEKNIFKNLCSE